MRGGLELLRNEKGDQRGQHQPRARATRNRLAAFPEAAQPDHESLAAGGLLVRAGVGGSLRSIGRQSGRIVFFACHQKIFLNHDVPTALQSLLSLGRETYFQNRRNIVLRALEEQWK